MADIKMEAEIFFDSHLPDALQRAQRYAGEDGFVASMPQLLHARLNASYNNIIWNTWFTANSEESVVKTPQGNTVVVTVHGGGIFASPARYLKLFHSSVARSSETGFTGLFSAKITEAEAGDVLQGKLPDGCEIPVFSFDDFKRGVSALPQRYAVVMDFERAKNAINGYESFANLKDDPLMIVRAGGVEAASTYLDKAKARHDTAVMGSGHSYSHFSLNQDELQTTVPLLSGNLGGEGSEQVDEHLRGMDSEYGLTSGISMVYVARYVAVAPRNTATTLRDLSF